MDLQPSRGITCLRVLALRIARFQRNIDNWARVYGDLARKIAADIH